MHDSQAGDDAETQSGEATQTERKREGIFEEDRSERKSCRSVATKNTRI